MFDIFFERFKQKRRTVAYPDALPALPPRFRGRPFIDAGSCRGIQKAACGICASVCPTQAIHMENGAPALDMGRCTFCGACARACPGESLVFTNDWRLASTEREALIIRPMEYENVAPASAGQTPSSTDACGGKLAVPPVTQSLPENPERRFLLPELPISPTEEAAGAFARSFKLRQVTAAGCGACEADINVLSTIVFDIGRFGMDVVASPRHADGMALTGPLPQNMLTGFEKCRNAMAEPRHILAIGTCAISGGLFCSSDKKKSTTQAEGAAPHCTPDLYIPGCPPHPYTELDGFLRFLGKKIASL